MPTLEYDMATTKVVFTVVTLQEPGSVIRICPAPEKVGPMELVIFLAARRPSEEASVRPLPMATTRRQPLRAEEHPGVQWNAEFGL